MFNQNYSILHEYNPKSKSLFDIRCIKPSELSRRVVISLIPPLVGKSRHVYKDFIGPLIAYIILSLLLTYGHQNKTISTIDYHPIIFLTLYITTTPIICYTLSKLGNCCLTFIEICAILGYALYGHVFTLIFSLLLSNEESNFVFFSCMAFFGGLSTLRVVLLLVTAIGKPGVRLLACSVISVMQMLFLMFLHFAYMHKTFVYGRKRM